MTTVAEWKAAHPAMRFTVKALCLVIVVGFVAVALKPAPASTPKAAPQSMLAKADRLDRVERPIARLAGALFWPARHYPSRAGQIAPAGLPNARRA